MDFKDLISDNSNRVEPLKATRIVGKNCRKCGEYRRQDGYLASTSWFFPDGYIDICNECLDKYFGDCHDIEKADKFCQYADLPFDPNVWMTLADSNGQGAFKLYATQNWGKIYETINWKEVQREWDMIIQNNETHSRIKLLSQEDFKDLQEKWGRDFTQEQLLYFENMYNEIDKTQSITTAIQRDNARKMCMLSYQIEKAIWKEEEGYNKTGTEVKALIGAYDQLAKAADFTPKTAKNVGDFESIGELCAFLEKRGYKNKFYDWAPRDEIDKVMQNLQKYTKRIVIGETNIAEELNNKLEQIQQMNRIEEDDNFEDEKYNGVTIDDELADELNEEFEVDD
ncbi:hypothetical protein IKB17_04230 [bacterium]|nr:hypothetical protein [bacterium]